MIAVVLAAGPGTRLRPLTLTWPKCLIPVCGKAVLDYQRDALQAIGVRQMKVIAGHLIEKVRAHASATQGVEVIENREFATTNIITSFALALENIGGEEDCLVIAGDVIFEPNVLKKLSSIHADLAVCVEKKQCGEEEVKVILGKNEDVIEFGKKLDPVKTQGEFLGVFLMRKKIIPEIREAVNRVSENQKGQAYLFDMLNFMVREKKRSVRACDVSGHLWEEIDFADDVERVSQKLKQRGTVSA